MFTLSWPQLLLVALVVLVVFGSGRMSDLPERRAHRVDRRAAPPSDPNQDRARHR